MGLTSELHDDTDRRAEFCLAKPSESELESAITANALFAEARRRARRRRVVKAVLLVSSLVIVAIVGFIIFAATRAMPNSQPASEPIANPDSTSCQTFTPNPIPSPNFVSALTADPGLLNAPAGMPTMSQCEAMQSAEGISLFGPHFGGLTAPTSSQLMPLAEADKLVPTGLTGILSGERPVWVVTVHRLTAMPTGPWGPPSKAFPTYSVVYDAQSKELMVWKLGSDALG